MKNLKIFHKMFLQTFAILSILIVLMHLLIFFVFPKTYLETRKQEVSAKADEIASNIQGRDLNFVEQSLDFYSKTSQIKAFVKEQGADDGIRIEEEVGADLKSSSNSLVIEEREIQLNTGRKIWVQFVSTADMQRDAKELSLKFLPYSLILSFLLSVVISLIYARSITKSIQEIKDVTDQMMKLDKDASLKVDSTNEVGQLKGQINELYETLLNSMEHLERKNQEVLQLEKLKYDFFRGASHEMKTPLASLKIILENMQYNVGKYKDRDKYIGSCLVIVDQLTRNISQMLSVSSLDQLKNDEEEVLVRDILQPLLDQYRLLAAQRHISVSEELGDETMYIGRRALKMVLSNLISNAVKYANEKGEIHIGMEDNWLYVENTIDEETEADPNQLFDGGFDLNSERGNGLGLYIVRNILSNYEIPYRVTGDKGRIRFLIRLASQ